MATKYEYKNGKLRFEGLRQKSINLDGETVLSSKRARNVHLMETGEHLDSSVAGSAFKFLLIIPLFFALFASLNGGQNVMHFETMLDMLAGAPALDISWIPQISGWTSGMSDIAQKIFGFILKPIEWSMYIITGLSQVLTFIGYIFYYIFAF